MAYAAQKIKLRSPRYTLCLKDKRWIRMKGEITLHSDSAELENLSISGLAFSVSGTQAPHINERIAIQFQVPGSNQMACYGRVVHVDHSPENKIMVGIRFENLSSTHLIALHRGLKSKFKEQYFAHLRKNPKNIFLFALFIILFICLFYFFFFFQSQN